MKRFALLLLLTLGSVLAACTPASVAPVRDELVTFTATIATADADEVTIRFGLHNGGNPLDADPAFAGRWELVGPDGTLRAAGTIAERPPLAGGQETTLITWTGVLDPGAYRLTWGAPDYGATVIEFDVEETASGLKLGPQTITETTSYPLD